MNAKMMCGLAVALAAPWVLAQDLTVDIPLGETYLGDVGVYRVAYQSYGADPVEMPLCWTGHFEPTSGISYEPEMGISGRRSMLFHSPWHVPPGKMWVDYRLRLPQANPITFSFGIAMKPDVAVPGKSDGVTFSCALVDGDVEKELLREHQSEAEWRDYTFDLTAYAGKAVTLRLAVEPGPNNNTSWDYSYFGTPTLTCGAGETSKAARIDELIATQAYRAVQGKDLSALSNVPGKGVLPSNLLEYRNEIRKTGSAYEFIYEGEDCRIVYTLNPQTGRLSDLTVQVDDKAAYQPALGGGVTGVVKEDDKEKHVVLQGGALVDAVLAPEDGGLRMAWQYPLGDASVQVAWRFDIAGKALAVSATCDEPVIGGFSLGHDGLTALRKTLRVPYLWGHLQYLPAQNVFTCRYLDWTQSHASQCPQGEASYHAKTDGTRNAMKESGYLAVSPMVQEVLPNLPHDPSPYIDLLGPRIMLDIWGHHKGAYQGDGENLRDLKDNGVDHVAIISHVWQRYGYDVKLPDHLPANPQFGGDEGMVAFGDAANECGYVWSLHENYIDLYPDAPSYDPEARVLRQDGSPSPAWFNKGTGVQSFGLKCNRALGYAKQNSPEIHRRFKTNAAYLDVHSCVPPWHQLDYDATQPMAAMALLKVQKDAELFQFERDTHEGPLFGEGNNQFYWAGQVDGVEAQVNGGEHHDPFLDFDLLKLHAQMVNHGMGYYERWFAPGYNSQWGFDVGTPEQVDKYRAQEIAYGHAGFIGNLQTGNIQWVAKEHHLMHPLQRLMYPAKPTDIAYEVGGRMVSASVALAMSERLRQRIRYNSGLTVWINWSPEPWEVEGRTLPQWGFYAQGPDTEVWTALHGGHFADYAECPEFLFADARTSFNMPYEHHRKDIEPRLADFEYLGGNRIRIGYEWVVNDTLEQDCHCFVHFLNEGTDRRDGIIFQQDHGMAVPTSQWKPGDVIKDGPHEIEVPEDQFSVYDIVIGLFKGARVPLEGVHIEGDRILLGRLRLEREGKAIKNVRFEPLDPAGTEEDVPPADFSAHLNPKGTWVDFGKVATDGSVKINKGERSLTIFPYPRDKAFAVTLDMAVLAPGSAPADITAQALAPLTQEDAGPVDFTLDQGKLTFTTRKEGAGRYLIRW